MLTLGSHWSKIEKITYYTKIACVFTFSVSGRGPTQRHGCLALAPVLESPLIYNIYIAVDLLCVDIGHAMSPLGLYFFEDHLRYALCPLYPDLRCAKWIKNQNNWTCLVRVKLPFGVTCCYILLLLGIVSLVYHFLPSKVCFLFLMCIPHIYIVWVKDGNFELVISMFLFRLELTIMSGQINWTFLTFGFANLSLEVRFPWMWQFL